MHLICCRKFLQCVVDLSCQVQLPSHQFTSQSVHSTYDSLSMLLNLIREESTWGWKLHNTFLVLFPRPRLSVANSSTCCIQDRKRKQSHKRKLLPILVSTCRANGFFWYGYLSSEKDDFITRPEQNKWLSLID